MLYREILINVVRDYLIFLFHFVVGVEIDQYLKNFNKLKNELIEHTIF